MTMFATIAVTAMNYDFQPQLERSIIASPDMFEDSIGIGDEEFNDGDDGSEWSDKENNSQNPGCSDCKDFNNLEELVEDGVDLGSPTSLSFSASPGPQCSSANC